MRVKVELHRDVVWFIDHRCTQAEARAFYRQLDAVREQPIRNSEALADPKVSRYMLRRFRFAGNVAIFKYNAAKTRIQVLTCRRARLREKPRPGRESADEP